MTKQHFVLRCGNRDLDLSRPAVMGILNVTPDSFSDGGKYSTVDAALKHAESMLRDGATMIDVGAESTRPGAADVSVQEELDRMIPVVEAISREFNTVISIDTSTPEVITAAAAAGAGFINDIRALKRAGALEAAAKTGLPVCVMHMQGEPKNMQNAPLYENVLSDVREFLEERVAACKAVGISQNQIVLDPGFGFGKGLDHNLQLLKHLDKFHELGLPLLVGMSRKSMLGAALGGAPIDERLYAGVAATAIAVYHGAHIVRVHDVKATADAVRFAYAVVEGI